jgi:tripartite ATP-independent transporter DctM subunit
MEWYLIFISIFGALLFLFATGMPAAICFLLVNIVGLYLSVGSNGMTLLGGSAYYAVAQFALVPIPLFILMGEILFRAGIASFTIDVVDKWIGRIPGRLSLTAIGGGALFGAVNGASMASVALLGSVLAPEMRRRGYKSTMVIAPILGAAGLAILIPPTALGVLLGSLAKVSIAKLLIAIILPGIILASMYAAYFFIRAWLNPALAPAYEAPPVSIGRKLGDTLKLIPVAILILLVTGSIFLGVATPSEAAALGVVGALGLGFANRQLTFQRLREAVANTTITTSMILLIIVGSTAFSQLLAGSGATTGLLSLVQSSEVTPLVFVIIAQLIIFMLGCFIDGISIMMITVPVFFPIVKALGIDPIWFSVLMLVQIELATITPPFGLLLFVFKGVQQDVALGEIYRAVIPIVIIQFTLVVLMLVFPQITSILTDAAFR